MLRIVNNHVAIPTTCLVSTATLVRGHNHRFLVPFARTQTYQFSFFPDIIHLWNVDWCGAWNPRCTSVDWCGAWNRRCTSVDWCGAWNPRYTSVDWLIDSLFPPYIWRFHKYINILKTKSLLFMTARCSAIHSWRSWWSWRLQLMMVSCSRDGWYRERMRIDKSEFWRMVRGVSGCVLSLVLLLKLSRLLGWLLGYWLYEASWWPYLPLVVARGQAVVTYFLQSWFDVNHQ
jgi:hypothetical protein